MAENRAEKILQILRKTLKLPKWVNSNRDPFKTLIITIIGMYKVNNSGIELIIGDVCKVYNNLFVVTMSSNVIIWNVFFCRL